MIVFHVSIVFNVSILNRVMSDVLLSPIDSSRKFLALANGRSLIAYFQLFWGFWNWRTSQPKEETSSSQIRSTGC